MLKLCKISACSNRMLGIHLSRAPWDPYPWISDVQNGSSAYLSGLKTGDTLLEINDVDVIGQKISQLAAQIHKYWDDGGNDVTFLIWRNDNEQNTINQHSVQKFATCLQNIAQLLECPICLEVVKPPGWQCCNGHVLCNSCRGRTVKCPICRVTLGPKGRCLLSDKLFTLLAETFPCDVKNQNNKRNNNYCCDRKTNTSSTSCSISKTITYPKRFEKDNKHIINISSNLKSSLPPQLPQNESYKMSSSEERTTVPTTTKTTTTTATTQTNMVVGIEEVVGVEESYYKKYHCPTGKSFCMLVVRENINDDNNENYKMYNHWDILTHLRRIHNINVTQYCGTYNEQIRIEFMNKSIPCISIIASDSTLSYSQCTSSSSSSSSASSSASSSPLQTPLPPKMVTKCSSNQIKYHKYSMTSTPIHHFIAQNQISNDNKIHKVPDENTIYEFKNNRNYCDDVKNIFVPDSCSSSSLSSSSSSLFSSFVNKKFQNDIELFFIVRIPISQNHDDDDKVCDFNDIIIKNLTNTNLNLNTVDDDDIEDNMKNNENENISNSKFNINCNSSSSSSKSYGKNNEKCAIFIWYCGNEINVKKFDAVIECKNTGKKWNGFIHSITKSWNLVQRQKEFIQLNFDVANFLNIVIRKK